MQEVALSSGSAKKKTLLLGELQVLGMEPCRLDRFHFRWVLGPHGGAWVGLPDAAWSRITTSETNSLSHALERDQGFWEISFSLVCLSWKWVPGTAPFLGLGRPQ